MEEISKSSTNEQWEILVMERDNQHADLLDGIITILSIVGQNTTD